MAKKKNIEFHELCIIVFSELQGKDHGQAVHSLTTHTPHNPSASISHPLKQKYREEKHNITHGLFIREEVTAVPLTTTAKKRAREETNTTDSVTEDDYSSDDSMADLRKERKKKKRRSKCGRERSYRNRVLSLKDADTIESLLSWNFPVQTSPFVQAFSKYDLLILTTMAGMRVVTVKDKNGPKNGANELWDARPRLVVRSLP